MRRSGDVLPRREQVKHDPVEVMGRGLRLVVRQAGVRPGGVLRGGVLRGGGRPASAGRSAMMRLQAGCGLPKYASTFASAIAAKSALRS